MLVFTYDTRHSNYFIIGPVATCLRSNLWSDYFVRTCRQKTIYVPVVNVRDDVVKNESEAYSKPH